MAQVDGRSLLRRQPLHAASPSFAPDCFCATPPLVSVSSCDGLDMRPPDSAVRERARREDRDDAVPLMRAAVDNLVRGGSCWSGAFMRPLFWWRRCGRRALRLPTLAQLRAASAYPTPAAPWSTRQSAPMTLGAQDEVGHDADGSPVVDKQKTTIWRICPATRGCQLSGSTIKGWKCIPHRHRASPVTAHRRAPRHRRVPD